ncbi:MAG TPA: hypothetical protein VM282_22200 [Acidimicrobiales bacterium]|nr:hypothetical protein [Acidimicrobiales bacterium]
MLAPRRSDVDQLNMLARQQLADDGTLRGVVLTVDGTWLQRGACVVTLRNDYHLGVRNGTLATITKIHGRSGEITIRPDHGKSRRISAAYLTEPTRREHAHRLEQGPEQRIVHTLATDHQQTLAIDR